MTSRCRLGGALYAVAGVKYSPFSACMARRGAHLFRAFAIGLRWRESRCCTTTSGAVKPEGRPARTALRAVNSPPKAV